MAKDKEYYREYYLKNRDKKLKQAKQNYESKKEEILEKRKEYHLKNRKSILERKNKHSKQYYKFRYSTKEGRASHLLTSYRRTDKKYNRGECTLTAKWIVENIFSQPCHYCGEADWHKLGCDRIDNSKPHTPDNVIPCCTECNKKRGTMTYEEFKKMLGEENS